ncbi:hypothetical protein D3C75_1065640 [compost metagenome]
MKSAKAIFDIPDKPEDGLPVVHVRLPVFGSDTIGAEQPKLLFLIRIERRPSGQNKRGMLSLPARLLGE